ncbi:MAG: 4Fe-4S ferredoxin [Chlamydiae bacterium]|nr:MAG: 4Fe-4S ferredoxin [Chlamydiota bacterium]
MKRKIIKIDEEKCNGCGECIPNCPEGALQIIDGKARLISDLFCDGLGACIGECPIGAISVEEREAEPYNEAKVMVNVVKGGPNVIKAHLKHLKDHNEIEFYNQAVEYLKEKDIEIPEIKEKTVPFACPGIKLVDNRQKVSTADNEKGRLNADETGSRASELRQWPTQLHLLNPRASYFQDADLLIAADCVPFTLNGFHETYLRGKTLLHFCPKLDNSYEAYVEKLAQILSLNNIKSITLLRMEVPCCGGTTATVKAALEKVRKNITINDIIVSLDGKIKN